MFKLSISKNENYIAGTGTVNATLTIMGYLTLLGYYNKENKTFCGFVYNPNTLDINIKGEDASLKVANIDVFLKGLKGVASSYNSACNDIDYTITDFKEFAQNNMSIVLKESMGIGCKSFTWDSVQSNNIKEFKNKAINFIDKSIKDGMNCHFVNYALRQYHFELISK